MTDTTSNCIIGIEYMTKSLAPCNLQY